MKTQKRKVSTKIDGTEYERTYTAVFPKSMEDILQLFPEEDALAIFNARLEVVQDNRERTELIKEHTPDKPKKSVKRIDYKKLYSSKPTEVPVDNEHLKEVLEKNKE